MLLEVENIQKSYPGEAGNLDVLNGVSFALAAGESVALTGESGSGKSTVLHIAAGLEGFDAGEIRIEGTTLSDLSEPMRALIRRDQIGIVFQQFNLIPSLSVSSNLSFQARLSGRVDADWIGELTDRLGLAEHGFKYPEQLSGGQQQRVAIGRALAARPKLVLADEPTGNLDEASGDAVMDLMLELVDQTGAGLLMVTHSRRLAKRLDRRLHLHLGKIEP